MTCFLVNPGNFAAVVPGLGPARAGLRSTWSGAEKYNNWVLKGDQWLLLYIFVYQLGSWNLMNRIGISNSNLEYESIYIYMVISFYLSIHQDPYGDLQIHQLVKQWSEQWVYLFTLWLLLSIYSGWWFGTWILFSQCYWNDDPICLSYFSGGLKPPTSHR